MKSTISLTLLALLVAILCPVQAQAWDCPSGQIRQQAPAGTPTNAPYYDVVEGIAFICVPATPSTPASTSSNSSSTSNSSSNSSSSSKSASNSNSTAKGGSATATGGNATGGSVTGSGNSSSTLKNSGNSTNTNTNTANGGAGGQGGLGGASTAIATGGQGGAGGSVAGSGNASQTQTSNSAATNNGNGANNSTYSNTTNVAATKVPVSTAVAPPLMPTVPCFKGFGAGVQTMAVGGSFGGGKVDENCAALETARVLSGLGYKQAGCLVAVSTKAAKKAGLTPDMCTPDVVEVPAALETIVAPPTQLPAITVNIPAPIINVPAQAPPVVNMIIPTPDQKPAIVVHAHPAKKHTVHQPCPVNPAPVCPARPTVFTNDAKGGIHEELKG